MPACPSCDQPSPDPGAQFCARCGTALTGVADDRRRGPDRVGAVAVGGAAGGVAGVAGERRPRSSAGAYSPRRSQGIPVAVAFVALTLGVLVAIALAGGSKGGSRPAASAVSTTGGVPVASAVSTAGGVPVATPEHRPAPTLRLGAASFAGPAAHYDAGSYSLAYPVGWAVAKSNQPIANYAETMLESRNATAKVTIDHTAGEITDPAVKAAQVEAATSRTPGYSRIAWRPLTIGGRSAFEWVFTLAGARDPRRADIFVNTGHDGFAFLAHGASWRHASAVARALAASVNVRG